MNSLDSPTWQKTIDDLFAEMAAGTRSSITDRELRLARAYEQSLFPTNIRIPKKGEVYEAIENVEISSCTHYNVPYTGGERFVFPKGERVRVTCVNGEKPIGVYCTPLCYEALHSRIVSDAERVRPEYIGYSLSIRTMQLNRVFFLVDGASP